MSTYVIGTQMEGVDVVLNVAHIHVNNQNAYYIVVTITNFIYSWYYSWSRLNCGISLLVHVICVYSKTFARGNGHKQQYLGRITSL